MKKCLAITAVGFQQMFADPMYLIFTLALPLLLTWAMSFLPREAGVYEMALLGVLVMFVALNLLTSAGSILEEKQQGTWQRLRSSATPYRAIMAGYLLRFSLVAAVQALLLLLSGKLLFGAPWNQGYGELAVVLAVYIFAMTGLGLFLAGLFKTQGQVQAAATGFVLVGSMLGDIFFPMENPSTAIKFITAISPQSWAAHALKDILLQGAALASLVKPLLWMGGLGLLLLTAGLLRLKTEM